MNTDPHLSRSLLLVFLFVLAGCDPVDTPASTTGTSSGEYFPIESYTTKRYVEHKKREAQENLVAVLRGRLNRARSYIEKKLHGVGTDVDFHRVEFDTYDVYGLHWSNVTIDVSYTHRQTGIRKRVVAKMDSNGVRVSMFRESYAADVNTGEKISDWRGW